jgi:hypothetical protein
VSKHTPGPWVNHGRITQSGLPHSAIAAKTLIARIYSEAFGDVDQEIANANLMAAAPDLFEALRLCYDHCRLYHPEVEHNNVGEAVRSALAKATGA